VNPERIAPERPSGFVTVTVTTPATLGGVVTDNWVALTTVTCGAATLPKVTIAPLANPDPLIVT
jgi:hypothetical protein